VTGTPATAAKHLGSQSIGLDAPTVYASLAASFDNVGISNDTNTNAANFDGNGASMSSQALAAAGAASGGSVAAGGLTFAWPAEGSGQNDNTLAAGQIIDVSGTASTLGFLYAATYGPLSGTGTIIYSDGSLQSYTLSATDWQATPTSGETAAITEAYQNRPGNTRYSKPSYVLYAGIPLAAGKTVTQVQLPNVGPVPVAKTAELHIFAIAIGP
jgi:alpha-L-fucosidase 2